MRALMLAAFVAFVASGLPAFAEDPASLAVEPEHERWIAKLTQRQEELATARTRAERAEAAYRDWRQRNYPRGAAKEAMLTELEEAREALRIAERRLPRDLEAARRDGVPPGTLRRFR